MLASVTEGDAAQTLGQLQTFYDAGGDVRQLVRGLLGAIREAALLSVGYKDQEGLGGAPSAALEKIGDRKSTRLNSSHLVISYAVFCLKKKQIQRHALAGAQR